MFKIEQTNRWTVIERNITALKEYYPELAQAIVDSGSALSPHVLRPKSGDAYPNILMDNHGEKILYYDAEDPMEYCKRYIESLDLKYAPALVFLGFGLGYQVVTALNDLSKKLNIQNIIVVEKDLDLFKTALTSQDFSQIIGHPNIKFFVGKQSDELYVSFLDYFTKNPDFARHFKSLKAVIMPSANLIEGQYYKESMNALRLGIQHLMQGLGNDPYDSLLGIENTLLNLEPMLKDPGIITFKNLFKGKPIIVVGAGPSLNKNIRLLKEASNKALLVCVDAALKPLLKIGIKPHITTNIERTQGQDAFFSKLAGLEDIYFVFCPLVHPSVYHAYQGPKIIANRYQEISDWLTIDPGSLSGSPLVGNFAFSIAHHLGGNPIIMVGQDMSFRSTGATHVKGMIFGTQEVYRSDMSEVEGNYGDTLMASRTFVEAKASLEKQIKSFDGLCINATEGGAKIKGTLFLDFRTSLKMYCKDTFDSLSLLKKHWHSMKPDPMSMPVAMQRIIKVLDRTISDLKTVETQCKKGLEQIESFKSNYVLIRGRKPNNNVLKPLKTVEKELNHMRAIIIANPSIKRLWQIFQCFHTSFEMKQSFLYDQYHSSDFAKLKEFLNLKEWFCIMGQLALSSIYAIERAKSKLTLIQQHQDYESLQPDDLRKHFNEHDI